MISFEEFKKKSKAVRYEERVQHTGLFSHTRHAYTRYFVYVRIDTLEVINPFTKKHEGREYKSFFSSVSADHAKEQAYNYIVQYS